jgi:hypothetical protein
MSDTIEYNPTFIEPYLVIFVYQQYSYSGTPRNPMKINTWNMPPSTTSVTKKTNYVVVDLEIQEDRTLLGIPKE